MSVRRMGRVARVGLVSGAVVTAVVVSGVLPAAAAVSTTSVVSAAPDGANANMTSREASVSSDGRYVAFTSFASNLVAGDTNGSSDVFVGDMSTGTVVLVSVSSDEVHGNSASAHPSISPDGRFVVFVSRSSNLVAGDGNAKQDVFVRDLTAGTTVLVSVDSAEDQADGDSFPSSISADGRYVAFESEATDLVPSDTNGKYDIFVRDLTAGTTVRASVDSSEAEATNHSFRPSISADGRYVAFTSWATNLVAGDTNGAWDVFVRDLTSTTTVRVSLDSDEAQADGNSDGPSISGDGRFVAFSSGAPDLVTGDTNGDNDVFVRDLTSTTTVRVSVDSDEAEATDRSFSPSITANGLVVAFQSFATNLVVGDTNGRSDIFTRDLTAGTTVRVSVNSLGVQGNFESLDPAISGDGQYVAFESAATNLTTVADPPSDTCDAGDTRPTYADDTNCRYDVFVAGSPAELPPTGGNPAGLVLVAVVLLGAGTCVLGLRRARTA